MKKNEESLRRLWDIRTPALWESQKEKRDKGTENLSEEIMLENFPNLGKGMAIQAQKVQRFRGRDFHQDTL